MNPIRIVLVETEDGYREVLARFLNQYGKGKWSVVTYSDWNMLIGRELSESIYVSTQLKELEDYIRVKKDRIGIYLANEDAELDNPRIYLVNRFQQASVIGKELLKVVKAICQKAEGKCELLAIYSPIGRCGKTTLARRLVDEVANGKWIYIGMEDYASTRRNGGDFIYYIKERNQEKVKSYIFQNRHMVIGSSVLEMRSINCEDIFWLQGLINTEYCQGMLWDIGTGAIEDYRLLEGFGGIIVPYLSEPESQQKLEAFMEVLDLYQLHQVKDKLYLYNVEAGRKDLEVIEQLFIGE